MNYKKRYCSLFICILLVILAFCGCSNKSTQKDFSTEIQEKWNLSASENQPEFLNLLDEKSSFECVETESLEDGYYVVKANVCSPDISESIKIYQKETYGKKISEEEMNAKLCELINSADIKTTEQTIDIIVDEDENVRVQFNDEFINAMFGYAYIDSMQTYMDEQKQEG